MTAQVEDGDYASVDFWLNNPSCGPSRFHDPSGGECHAVMLGATLFHYETRRVEHPERSFMQLRRPSRRRPMRAHRTGPDSGTYASKENR